jgi:Protein of unknown function (DUF3000)
MTRAEAVQPGDAAAGFGALVAELREQRDQVCALRPELSFEDVPAPRTLAPYATALAATVLDGDTDIASGRLVLLYDPAGQDGWGGPLRIIVYIRADLDPEIAADPLIGQVGWDWLTEALDSRTAGYGQPSGTVTRVVTEGFGAKESEPAVTGFELRASWSPAAADDPSGAAAGAALGEVGDPGEPGTLDGHLAAWCDALCAAAGLPPLAPGVTALRTPASTTRRRR